MRALTHRLNQRLIDWPKRRIDGSFAVQPWLGIQWLLFITITSRKKCVANYFRHQKMLLKRSKTMFQRCLNRSGKTNTKDGRTSKHSEYGYASKCQAFLWKCQFSHGNTRNMLDQAFFACLGFKHCTCDTYKRISLTQSACLKRPFERVWPVSNM